MIEIFVDGDACPVKDEVYAVAARLGLAVVVVANQRMRVPPVSYTHLTLPTICSV